MITDYIQSAMAKARYDILEDETYYGEIHGFKGVWANADTLDACRGELQEVLEEWIVLALQLGQQLPRIRGVRHFPKPKRIAG